jgi:hypothetical protein
VSGYQRTRSCRAGAALIEQPALFAIATLATGARKALGAPDPAVR